MNKTLGAVLVVVFVIATIGAYLFPKVQNPLGAISSPQVFDRMYFYNNYEVGGGNLATSSAGAATYTAAQVFNNKLITHTASGALTATLPASTTISQIVGAGMSYTLFLTPITTGITVAGGTGTELNAASTSAKCLVGSLCRLDFIRKSNTDIEVLLTL